MDAQRRANVLQSSQRIRQLRNQEQALRLRTNTIPQHLLLPPPKLVFPTGLKNLGNTCYLNATLQCLRHSTPFVEYLMGEGFIRDRMCFVNQRPLEQAFLGEYHELMANMSNRSNASVQPTEFLRLLVHFNSNFAGGAQSDAQECLSTILQTLHVALRLNVKITVNGGEGTSDQYARMRKGIQQYETHLKHDGYSVIDEIFGSQFESRLTCERCGHISAAFDPYSSVPVEIGPRALTLYDCLDQFMGAEQIEDVHCDRCGPHANVTKQFRLWTLPKMLLVQLKRFDLSTGGMRKIAQFVQSPKILNLTKYVSHPRVVSQVQNNPAALQLYDLKGVVCHTGNLQNGHYTAKCFDEGSSTVQRGWYDFNDEHVSLIPEARLDQLLQSPSNYILFYEMHASTKAFWKK